VDATTLAFAGDCVTDQVNGVWSVDVLAAQPSAAIVELVPQSMLSPAQGVLAAHLDVDAQGRVYFSSDHGSDGLFQLFRVAPDGGNLEQVPGTLQMDGGAEDDVQSFALSPDGRTLAFATRPRSAGIGQVYTVDVTTGAGVATAVTSFTGTPDVAEVWSAGDNPIAWNAAQTMLAFTGDWKLTGSDVDDADAIFVASVADDAATRIALPTVLDPAYGAYKATFSSDGTRLFFQGFMVSEGENDLMVAERLDVADQDVRALQIVACPDGGDVTDMIPTP
jgi:hypothetical protein